MFKQKKVLRMEQYTRITKQERYLIELGIRSRKSRKQIGLSIARPTKTVSEEIKRNGGYLGYYAAEAHYKRAGSNRKGYSKIDRNVELQKYIRMKLLDGWSPEVIAGRWNKTRKDIKITHETIYTWIYKQDDDLYLMLPRKKKKRGNRPQRIKRKIPNRVSIHDRSDYINNRSEIGHYEGDLMFQKGNQSQNILSIVERKSRKITLIKNESKRSDVVMGALQVAKDKIPYPIRTITFDNGSEFTKHSILGVDTYFCDPGSPWQKGAIENVNGIVRRYVDYRVNIKEIDQETLNYVAKKINDKPRKILGYLTPNEVFSQLYNENLQGVTF